MINWVKLDKPICSCCNLREADYQLCDKGEVYLKYCHDCAVDLDEHITNQFNDEVKLLIENIKGSN